MNLADIERHQTYVEISSACGAALTILNELLLHDKMMSGVLSLHKTTVNIPDFVNDALKMFQIQVREKRINFIVSNANQEDSTENITVIQAKKIRYDDTMVVDKNQMTQVLRNFVSNAIKFTPEGGQVSVDLQIASDHLTEGSKKSYGSQKGIEYTKKNSLDQDNTTRELVITVKDTGAGISIEDQKKLFKDVVQFKPEVLQNGGGSGLGMVISKQILDMHGGRKSEYDAFYYQCIYVGSNFFTCTYNIGSVVVTSPGEGLGTSFTIKIPIDRQNSICTSAPIGKIAVFDYFCPEYENRQCTILKRRPNDSHSPKTTQNDSDSGAITPTNDSETYSPSLLCSGDGMCECENSDAVTSRDENDSSSTSSSAGAGNCDSDSFGTLTTRDERESSLIYFLVVDDSKMNRRMLRRLLGSRGVQCSEASDGAEAVDALMKRKNDMERTALQIGRTHSEPCREYGFDAILMDYMMPNMDGPTATAEIRKLGYRGPIIGATGNALPKDVDYFLKKGANAVLLKPLDIDQIFTTLSGNIQLP